MSVWNEGRSAANETTTTCPRLGGRACYQIVELQDGGWGRSLAVYKAKFGRNLTILINVREMTPLELAKKIGVSRTMVYKYMAGKNLPEGEALCKMADILGLSIDALVGRKSLILAEVGPEANHPEPPVSRKKK